MKNRTNNTYKTRLSGAQRAVILAIAILTAIAIAVTCALCFDSSSPVSVESVESGVTTSTNRGTLTGDQSAPGKLNNGDVITYSYTGGVQSITLPIGEFRFVVRGADGGTGYNSYPAAAGRGGTTTATIKFTSVTTIYIVVGGKGTNYPRSSRGTAAGGYNGGGTAKSNRTCSHGGGGGGGATHIATYSGTLSSLSGRTGNILIVAGGGGGAGNSSSTSYYGGGGGTAKTGGTGVVAGGNAGLYAKGGLTNGGGTCTGTSGLGGSGGFGVGGSSTGRSNYVGGAGGGGGYYGGAGGAGPSSCSAYGGGGGASYVSGSMYNAVYTRGASSSSSTINNGSATINVINVNQKPTTANPVKNYNTGITRTNGSVVVSANEIAVDPDVNKTTLAFTDGKAGSLTTVTKNSSTGLYLNSACTVSADKYLSWAWTDDSRITVNGVKMYPRSGVDGCTLNGRLTLYAKVRDSYANTPSQYEWNTVYFYLTVRPEAVGRRADGTEITTAGNGGPYYIGMSKTNSVANNATSLDKDNIYNPNHADSAPRYTVNIARPLQKDVPFVIKASDLLTNVCPNKDIAVIALNSTAQITGSNPKFVIREYNQQSAGSALRPIIYNKSKVQIANAFTQLTLVCQSPDPQYQVLSVTLYAVETNTAYTTEKNVSADINPISLDIVFKMDNNRPTLINSTVPVVTLDPMKATTIDFSSANYRFYTDEDTGNLSSSTHYIRGVKVPETEYVQLDKYGNVVSTVNGTSSYFNVVPNTANGEALKGALTDSLTTGTLSGAAYSTGFDSRYISSGASNSAFVQYSFGNMSLTLTGLRATHSMYLPTRTTNSNCVAGSTSDPTATAVANILNPGHFYILINVIDRNDTNDQGIWLPLGIEVKNNEPKTTDIERNGAGASKMPTASGAAGDGDNSVFYFTPMGITIDRVTTPLGAYAVYDNAGNITSITSAKLQPLASDSDNFFTSDLTYGGKLNELVQITSDLDQIYESVAGSTATSKKYFTLEFIDLFVPVDYFGGRVLTSSVVDKTGAKDQRQFVDIDGDGSTEECVKLKGIKLTLKNYTHNRYLFANVGLRDSSNVVLKGGANIAVNVTNVAPKNNTANNVARISYKDDGKTVETLYNYSETGTATITYNMPVNSTAIITPYDLLWDGNLTADGITYPQNSYSVGDNSVDASAFTLNGLSGSFNNGLFSVDDKSGDGRTINGLAAPKKATNAYGNYASETYKDSLKDTIKALNGKRTFGALSSSNVFGTAQETKKTSYVDGLFFARTTDGANLDGYNFDPYAADATKFESPSIVGGSYISYAWGNKIRFSDNGVYNDANTFNLDYLVITALSRTQVAPVEIELNVRDRMGTGASGNAQGISKIKVLINIINSTPRVQYDDRIYTLTTSPTAGSETGDLENAQEGLKIKPSTIVFYAAASEKKEDRYKDFLTDNEGDPIMFYTTSAVTVLDEKGSDKDASGNRYFGNYVSVVLTSETLTVTALNSTQNINTLYVGFDVTDGRSTDGRTLDHSTCYIRVEVINSAPIGNDGENGFEYDSESMVYRWNVETVNSSDITRSRYFASSDGAVQALMDGTVMGDLGVATSGQIKKVTTDTDMLQRPILQKKHESQSVVLVKTDDADSMRGGVPTIGFAAYDSVRFYLGANSNVLINDKALEPYVNAYDILYFVKSTPDSDQKTAYSAKALADATKYDDEWWTTNWSLFYDDQGRWIVGDWALYITPKTASGIDTYISLAFWLRDETVFGGDTAGANTAYSGGAEHSSVNALATIHYSLYVESMGIIPYTYYNQFNGYYTVADSDGKRVYISTYDGDDTSFYTDDIAEDDINSLYLDGNKINTEGKGTPLKTRGRGVADGTYAGVHSGAIFDASKEYNFTGDESAFKYTDTIEVSADKNAYTYIPMSYFATRPTYTEIDANDAIKYTDNTFVAYDLGYSSNGVANEYTLTGNGCFGAISISDGKNVWTGAGEDGLNANPYILFTRYTKDSSDYNNTLSSPYFNNCLAIPSIKENGEVISANVIKNNSAHLVGKDGRLLYLNGQRDLMENTFGIGLQKKNTRSSATSLTMTIKVAECQYAGSTSNVKRASAASTNDTKKDSATLTFKIVIGNAPVDLVTGNSETSGVMSTPNGYHTRLNLTTGSSAKSIRLVRNGTSVSSSQDVVNIPFTDDDVVRNADNTINTAMSDGAYFYPESLTPMNTAAGVRARKYKLNGESVEFTNASAQSAAQNSLRNYFGSRDPSTFVFSSASASNLGFADTDSNGLSVFQPNGGIYGTNMGGKVAEGYSKFFRTSISPDGTTLTVTPLAKTTLNTEMTSGLSGAALTKYYNERGLEYVAGAGYYPLKVLVYDSHGDGPEAGSFVALEIRVYISGSEPTLSGNLENDTRAGAKAGDKKIEVKLPVDATYQFSLTDVISSNTLLTRRDDGEQSNDWYWYSDYLALKNRTVSGDYVNMFRLDTGSYLKSPFEGWSKTTNSDLVSGRAKFSDGKLLKTDKGNLPDVIMYMDYDGAALSANSPPTTNTIQLTVNRRTTFNSQAIKNFKFELSFTDNGNHQTNTLTVYVEVSNKAPDIRSSAAHEVAQELRMRVGDYFTVLTTPYDRFLGAEKGITESASATASTSYGMLKTPRNISQRNLCMIQGDTGYSSSTVHFTSLTSAALDTSGEISNGGYMLHSYDRNGGSLQNLGYLAVADDDTPWALRIDDVVYYDNNCFNAARKCDLLPDEGKTSGDLRPLDVVIVAASVCTRMPITITVIDGDGARATFTMYVTVESSSPVAIGSGDRNHKLSEALTTVKDQYTNDIPGVYETYMMAYTANGSNVHEEVNVSLDGGATKEGKPVKAYGEFTVNINEIAYDPDVADNNNIAMYSPNDDYNTFLLNGMPLTKSGLHYYNDIFDIKVADNNYQSFTVKCLTYNPDFDTDELTFYVGDYGNNVFENAIPVTIRLHTLYSEMTNDWQFSGGKVTAQGQFNTTIRNAVDTVYVKGYDDYTGVSAYVKDLAEEEKDLPDEEKTKIAGVDSTYQFLNYGGMPESIDQTVTGWGINDADVINNKYNLNYDVRVYALMTMNETDNSVYDPLPLAQASQLLDMSGSQYSNHYMWLRDANAARDYLVGGVRAGGGSYTSINKSLLMFINKYFVFDMGADGVSLMLRPVTSNINVEMLLYVEVEKHISDSRLFKTVGAATKSGSIFYVKVKDSAPVVNSNESILNFSGKVGESHIFPIFDKTNPFASMFNDSDIEDIVRVNGFIASGNTNEDYAAALEDADCDWQAAQGKTRAIEIAINNDDIEANGIPAHSLKITVLRRIDKVNEDGSYASEVTFPVHIWGWDKSDQKVRATLTVTVANSDVEFNTDQLADSARFFDGNGVGYEIYAPESVSETEEPYDYAIDVKIAPNEGALNVNLVAGRWFVDPDFTSMAADTDSYKLIKPISPVNENKYLLNGALAVKSEGDESVATVTPIYGNNGTNIDANHFVGFGVTADSHKRDVKGVAYMRVIDRSGRGDNNAAAGITIKLNIEVLNAAPTVKSKDIKSFYIVGSDSKDGDPITIKASDYVEDVNADDSMYIVGMLPIKTDETEIHCTVDTDNGGNIVNVELVDGSIDSMRIIPRKGFYGTQDVQITVADGDLMSDPDARTVSFTVRVSVTYDINNVTSLNSVSAVRSIPTKITPEMLFSDIIDTYDSGLSIGTGDPAPAALASDDEQKSFNPGRDYVIVGLSSVSPDVAVSLDNDGDWQFVCSREVDNITFDVSFNKRTDAENGVENPSVYTRQFSATVGKNHAPTLLENFTRANGYTFYTRESDYGLDGNGTIALTTGMLFSDVDIELGDRLLFDPNAMSATSSTMVSMRVSDDRTILYLTFNYRGETDITIGVVDRTGETTKATLLVKNVDRPSAPFMSMIKISVETHPYIWLGVGVGILALILFIILLVVLLKRRKRKREELESVLISELELEEQMLRIANTSNAMYQSFGYLPPTMPQQADPGLMLGGGASAPVGNNAIGLNPGGDNGVPNDSDM